LTAPSYATLLKRLEDAQAAMLPGQKSMDVLTMHYIANGTFADQLHQCYQELENGLTNIDVLKATGSKLDAIVSHVLMGGRLLGEFATGDITFSSDFEVTEAIVIPAGTRTYAILEDGTKLYFETTVASSIPIGETQAVIASQAVLRGTSGNIGAYQIVAMVSRITGISSVENALPFEGGTEDEADTALRERYFDAIQAPGKATILMLERALNDIVSEAHVISYGSGDVGILVDWAGGIEEASEEIVGVLRSNLAAGIQARGCLGASINGASSQVFGDDVYGGKIWIRPRNFVAEEEILEGIEYFDMAGQSRTATATIPAATHRGTMIEATMDALGNRGKKILSAPPSAAGNNYDMLLGMGETGYLYNLPELIEIGITAPIRLTDTREADLVDNITASLQAYLGAFLIGERLEYSDVLRFFQNLYDPAADDCIGRAFIGIEEIEELLVAGGEQTASQIGDRITVEEDWRIEAGDITITIAED
jgi:hypothetical protein